MTTAAKQQRNARKTNRVRGTAERTAKSTGPASAESPSKTERKRSTPDKTRSREHAEVEAPARSTPMEHDLGPDELEFIAALDTYKKANGRPFPSWSEVLHVLRSLGYRKS